MSSPNRFSHWTDYLRRHSSDASLEFGADGVLPLLVERHKVDCRIVPEFLILQTRICGMPTPDMDLHAWLRRVLMLTNTHAHSRREFPVLAGRTLQLHAWIGIRTEYQDFCGIFDQFLDALEAWRQLLAPQRNSTTLQLSRLGPIPFSSVHSISSDTSQGKGNS